MRQEELLFRNTIVLHQGKDKPETCSGGNGNQGDGTALSFHKPAHNGEPQAQTTGPRRPEALKNGFRPFGRNARPHVMNIPFSGVFSIYYESSKTPSYITVSSKHQTNK